MVKTANLTSSLSRNAGGLFYSVRRLVQAVADEGKVDVEVLGLGDAFTQQDLHTWAPLRSQVFPTLGPQAYGYSWKLDHALRHSDFELLHNHGMWMYPSYATLQWWKRHRRPYLISPHGMLDPWAMRNSAWKKAIASALYEGEHLRRAACLRSLCASETQSMRDLGLTQPICQIPNGVDLPPPPATGPAPWADRLKPGDKVLFNLGRLHPKKGLPALIEAYSRVQKSGRPGVERWRLAIAGWDQGGHEALLKQLALDHGMGEQIIFTGPLFDQAKADAFQAADAFVLPSHSEGLPIAVLEAWSYGLPVLMTPECNIPEGFAAGAAIQVSTDADVLEQSLRDFFAEDPQRQRAMGKKGLELVEQRFTWKRIGQDMTAVYLWLLKGGPAPACVIQ